MPHAFRHMPANSCLFLPPSDAPSSWRQTFCAAAPKSEARALRSPIGTAMLSYAEHGKSRAQVQAHRYERTDTSAEPQGVTKKEPAGPIRHEFLRCPAIQVDHGMRASAMGATAPRENLDGLITSDR